MNPHLPSPFGRVALLCTVVCLAAGPLLAEDRSVAAGPTSATTPPAVEPSPGVPLLLATTSDARLPPLPDIEPGVPSPAAFLGYPLGARFTPHARMVAYLEQLATSDRVRLERYGASYEGRPLVLAVVSSPANLARLPAIRAGIQRLADPRGLEPAERARLVADLPVVVWLGHGIHGNEPSSGEAALATAYLLAAARGDLAAALDRLVVVIDPAANPDGRERTLQTTTAARGRLPDPDPAAAEHREPWPGGRTNHYLVDLNRDWAWVTQQESQARLSAFRAWEPQVAVDLHEMDSAASYYFPPNAEPTHSSIDRRVTAFFEIFARANRSALDALGWSYFARERFDLYYPGYGDSYPSLRGTVGMTYEVGGHAGLAVALPGGGVLTLADRVARHVATSLATVRTAARESRRLLDAFVAARLEAVARPRRTYVWPADAPEATAMADLLAAHGILVETFGARSVLEVTPLDGGPAGARELPAGTFSATTAQPLGDLLRALMEEGEPFDPEFVEHQRILLETNVDPEFADVTAWALPLAFNVPTWSTGGLLPRLRRYVPRSPIGRTTAAPLADLSALYPAAPVETAPAPAPLAEPPVGHLVPAQGLATYRLAARLAAAGTPFHVATGTLSQGGSLPLASGSLFVPRSGGAADGILRDAAATGTAVLPIASSHVEGVAYMGSASLRAVRPSRIGILMGAGTDPTTAGHLWYLLDQMVEARVTRLELGALAALDLRRFDVLVLPGGRGLAGAISETAAGRLVSWVDGGGILVALGEAVRWLDERDHIAFSRWEASADDTGDPENGLAERPVATPGAALATELAAHHPMAIGVPSPPPVLFSGSEIYEPSGDPRRDVLLARGERPVIAGFAWPEATARLGSALLMGVEPKGRGAWIVFPQDPAFRLFWRGTMPLFLNATLLGPTLLADGDEY